MTPSRGRFRAAAIAVPLALATAMGAASAAPAPTPIPVKDEPDVVEDAPTSQGPWFGWSRDPAGDPEHVDFFVQRGTRARVKVNAAGTQGFQGGFAGHSVFYVQKRGDRPLQVFRYDLETGHRAALPPAVNGEGHGHLRGDVTVGGPWLLFSGYTNGGNNTIVLYNRVTRERRMISKVYYDTTTNAGQVNGRYATYVATDPLDIGSDPPSSVVLYDIKTDDFVVLDGPGGGDVIQHDPAVSSDGTVYYFVTDVEDDGPFTSELTRVPPGGSPEVVTTVTSEDRPLPGQTFVKDRPDGSRVVYFSWNGGTYKVVDVPDA